MTATKRKPASKPRKAKPVNKSAQVATTLRVKPANKPVQAASVPVKRDEQPEPTYDVKVSPTAIYEMLNINDKATQNAFAKQLPTIEKLRYYGMYLIQAITKAIDELKLSMFYETIQAFRNARDILSPAIVNCKNIINNAEKSATISLDNAGRPILDCLVMMRNFALRFVESIEKSIAIVDTQMISKRAAIAESEMKKFKPALLFAEGIEKDIADTFTQAINERDAATSNDDGFIEGIEKKIAGIVAKAEREKRERADRLIGEKEREIDELRSESLAQAADNRELDSKQTTTTPTNYDSEYKPQYASLRSFAIVMLRHYDKTPENDINEIPENVKRYKDIWEKKNDFPKATHNKGQTHLRDIKEVLHYLQQKHDAIPPSVFEKMRHDLIKNYAEIPTSTIKIELPKPPKKNTVRKKIKKS